MPDAENRYTLITGASSGIGRAIAVRLSATRRLILHGRDLERLNETRLLAAAPNGHLIWSYDLREINGLAESLSSLLADSAAVVECFIHSAGLLTILPIRAVDYKSLGEVMNVNFASALQIVSLLTKKRVNRQQLKNVLFISSIIANFGAPGFSMYSASKGALDGAMRALAIELAPAVRVNSILPGGIRTQMTEDLLNPEVMAKLERDYPLGLGQVEDIVNAAEFVVSDKARWVTGQQIVIDGGRTANISI